MQLEMMSESFDEYLRNTEYVDYNTDNIKELQKSLFENCKDDISKIEEAYYFVRDNISHSWDIKSRRITIKASQVLKYKEGICYAKSNLLAALLRSQGIPTGFGYQKLTIGDTVDTGYCIHALNIIYITSLGRWVRLDARGNKEGINAKFSIEKESLAFPIRAEYGEVDYNKIYAKPHPLTIDVLEKSVDCLEMYVHNLPTDID